MSTALTYTDKFTSGQCPCYKFLPQSDQHWFIDDKNNQISIRKFPEFGIGGIFHSVISIPRNMSGYASLIWGYKSSDDFYELRVENVNEEILLSYNGLSVAGNNRLDYVEHNFADLSLYRYYSGYTLLDKTRTIFFINNWYQVFDPDDSPIIQYQLPWEEGTYKEFPVYIQTFPKSDGGTLTIGQYGYPVLTNGLSPDFIDSGNISSISYATVKTKEFLDLGNCRIGFNTSGDFHFGRVHPTGFYAGETGNYGESKDFLQESRCPQVVHSFSNINISGNLNNSERETPHRLIFQSQVPSWINEYTFDSNGANLVKFKDLTYKEYITEFGTGKKDVFLYHKTSITSASSGIHNGDFWSLSNFLAYYSGITAKNMSIGNLSTTDSFTWYGYSDIPARTYGQDNANITVPSSTGDARISLLYTENSNILPIRIQTPFTSIDYNLDLVSGFSNNCFNITGVSLVNVGGEFFENIPWSLQCLDPI